MLLVDLPPEIIVQVFLHLNPQDLLSCRLANSQLNLIVRDSVLVQYNALLQEKNLEDNSCAIVPFSEKLANLKQADAAWGSGRARFTVNVPVLHQQSGVYDLTGGVYLLSDSRRSAMHYLRLPRTVEDVLEWKVIKSSASIIDIGLCLFEHDMIVNVTTTPYRESVHSPLSHSIHMDILQFSTGQPHPQARNQHILVLKSQWEKPGIGIEIVGEHLVLVLCYYNTGGSPDDHVFVYEWKTGLVKMHFTAPYRTYAGLLFLTEDIFVLPNCGTNSLDFFRIPSKESTVDTKPILALALPRLAPGHHMGGISCRAEPNPIGKTSKFGQTKPSTGDSNVESSSTTAINDARSAEDLEDSAPKCSYLPDPIDAICLFDLRIFMAQMVLVQGGVNMQVQFRNRFSFVAHRRAFLDLFEKWGDGKWEEREKKRLEILKEGIRKEKEQRRKEREDRRKELESIKEWKKHEKQQRLDQQKSLEASGIEADAMDTRADGEQSSSPFAHEEEDDDQPPPLLAISDSDDSSINIESDSDTDQEVNMFTIRRLVPYIEWGPNITRWFNSDHVGTHWITTTAGEKCVRMAESPHGGHPYTILDFNQRTVEKVKDMLKRKEAREAEEKAEAARNSKGKGKEKAVDHNKSKMWGQGWWRGNGDAKRGPITPSTHHDGRATNPSSGGDSDIGASGLSPTVGGNGISRVNGPRIRSQDTVSEPGSTTAATAGSSTTPSLPSPPATEFFDEMYDDMPGLTHVGWSSPSPPPPPPPGDAPVDEVPLNQAQIMQMLFGHGGAQVLDIDDGDDEWEDAEEDMDEDQEFFSDDGGHESAASDDIVVVPPGAAFNTMLDGGDFDGGPVFFDAGHRQRQLERERADEAYTEIPPNRIHVEDEMRQVSPSIVFSEPVEGRLPYVAITTEDVFPFNGILLDEERVIGVNTNEPGDIKGISIHYLG